MALIHPTLLSVEKQSMLKDNYKLLTISVLKLIFFISGVLWHPHYLIIMRNVHVAVRKALAKTTGLTRSSMRSVTIFLKIRRNS